MADLYSRLRQLKQEREGPAGSSADSSAPVRGIPSSGSPPVREMAPGPGWRRVAPGVFERTIVEELAPGIPPDFWTRYRRARPLVGAPRGCSGVDAAAGAGLSQEAVPSDTPVSDRSPELPEPVFIDVETSGLSSGAGSTAFLIGIGRLVNEDRVAGEPAYTDVSGDGAPGSGDATPGSGGVTPGSALGSPRGRVAVTQLFLSEPASEPLMLARLHELLEPAGDLCWVSYNGGSFDLPVMRTRHILCRMRFPEHQHWDLLHTTRRLWAPVIGPCNLGRVEARVLGLSRHEDVPGSEVPERYHRFIDKGDPSLITPVVSHHAYDVAHLASLAGTLLMVAAGEAHQRPGSPPDRLALVRMLLQRGAPEQTDRCVQLLDAVVADTRERRRLAREAARRGGFTARAAGTPSREWGQVRELRAVLARRSGDSEREAELRRELYEERGARHDLVELAKVLEHRLQQPADAAALIRDWVRRHDLELASDAELSHRLERLERRAGR